MALQPIGYMVFMMSVKGVIISSCGRRLQIVSTVYQLVMLLFSCYHDNCCHGSCNDRGNHSMYAWRIVS